MRRKAKKAPARGRAARSGSRRTGAKRAASKRRVTTRATAKRATAKRATTKRATTKRATTKRAATKGATAKRAARKGATRKGAAMKRATTTRTASTRARARGSASRRTASGARLSLVRPARRPARAAAARPATGASFPQRAGASPRMLVLFDLLRARAAFHAAIHGLAPGATQRPIESSGWTVREHVLHLCQRDERATLEIEPAARGTPVAWSERPADERERMDAEGLARLASLGWDDALRRLHGARAVLMEAMDTVPEEPAEPWSGAHPLRTLLLEIAENDRRHADVIKRWRAEYGV